ncbi:MAG: hypothetical protein ACI9MC_000633 [Kiritimatiellia bacterium]|jgi:hypothetical protein
MIRSLTISALLLLPLAASAGKVTIQDAHVDDAYRARRVALLVGVDTYQDGALNPLAFAAKDAQDVADALQAEDIGGYDEVHVLIGQQATSRENIEHTLREVASELQRDDTILLYFSGHGTLTLDPIDGTELWFLPSDAQLDNPSETGLQVSWLEEALAAMPPKRRVLIMDTCHNGRADGSRSALSSNTQDTLSRLRGDPPAPNAVREVTESEARLYAAQYYQPAMEDRSLKNGVYTHFLLEAMTDGRAWADLNSDGLVDITEAHDFAQDKTIRHTGGLQVPRAEYSIVGREAIYLAGDPNERVRAESALLSAYNGLLAKASLFVDGQPRGSLPGVVSIEPGKHHIEVRTTDGRVIYAEKLRMKAGDHTQVEQLMGLEAHSRFRMIVGAAVTHGSSSLMMSSGVDMELGYMPASRAKVVPEFHARFTSGPSAWTEYDTGSIAAMPAAGVWLGWRANKTLSLGPQAEVAAPFHRLKCDTCSWDIDVQYKATVVPGLRAEVQLPMKRAGEWLLRYDVRVVPTLSRNEAGDSQLTAGVVHGVAVGGAFR